MVKRQKWTEEEDEALVQLVNCYGGSNVDWEHISSQLFERGFRKQGKQARERWIHYLSPNLKKEALGKEENQKLFRLHGEYGSRWKIISESFCGRTDNNIKNQFFALIRKSLRRARKAGQNEVSSEPMNLINVIKPKMLSLFLSKEIAMPELDGVPPPSGLTWMKNPLLVRDFISFFAFTKHTDIVAISDERVCKVISTVLSKLTQMNEQYCSQKQRIETVRSDHLRKRKIEKASRLPPVGTEPEEPIQVEGPATSVHLASQTFFFYLKQLTELLGSRSPQQCDVIEILACLKKSASSIEVGMKTGNQSNLADLVKSYRDSIPERKEQGLFDSKYEPRGLEGTLEFRQKDLFSTTESRKTFGNSIVGQLPLHFLPNKSSDDRDERCLFAKQVLFKKPESVIGQIGTECSPHFLLSNGVMMMSDPGSKGSK